MNCRIKPDCVVYTGDFDFRNENVQSFLVRNNAKILQSIGFEVAFIGINTCTKTFNELNKLESIRLDERCSYYELPNTLNTSGLFMLSMISRRIVNILDEIESTNNVKHLISYQCPSYSIVLNRIIKWCRTHSVRYIVNCADLPTFDIQPIPRRYIMAANWSYLHRINTREADGIIAVSKYIQEFYRKGNRPSTIIPPLFDEAVFKLQIKERKDIASFVYAGTPFKITGGVANERGMKDRLDIVIDLFLELTKQKVPFLFRIIGIEKKDYLTGVPRHRTALESCQSIEFLGRRGHNETLQLVSDSDYSINYRDENLMTKAGFSTKIVESISVGTPVIINSISDTFEYVKQGITGFMLSGNGESDAMLLKELCALPDKERKAIKQACFDCGVFHFENYTAAMREFLDSI